MSEVNEIEVNPINVVSRRHPYYLENVPLWRFYKSTYEGGKKWFADNIYKYDKELPSFYDARLKRAYRFNHTKEIVDTITKYIFKGEISRREDAPECLKKFWNKASKFGGDIQSLMKLTDKDTSIYGRAWVIVDSTNVTSEVKSIEEEKKENNVCYAYLVNPENVLDLAVDDQGELLWILIFEPKLEKSNPFNQTVTVLNQYRLWTRDSWFLFEASNKKATNSTINPYIPDINQYADISATLVSEGKHNLGQVPAIPVDNMISENEYTSQSFISDISYLDKAVANYLSNLDAIIQDQTFSQLVIPDQALMQDKNSTEQLITMSTKSMFTYNAEAGQAPQYISPDPKQASIIMDVVSKIIGEIYFCAGMSTERTKQDNAVGIDNSSGVAKAYDFEKINSFLCYKATNLEKAENKIAELVCKWNGVKPSENSYITYPKDFDVKSLYDEFEIAAQLSLLDSPMEIRREQMKMIIEKLFPSISEEKKMKMIKDLDKWEVDTIVKDTTSKQEGKTAKTGLSLKSQTLSDDNSNRQGQVTKNT